MRLAALLSFTVIFAAFELGSSLRCYQCITSQVAECAGPPSRNSTDAATVDVYRKVDCSSRDLTNFNWVYLRKILPAKMLEKSFTDDYYCAKIVTGSGDTVRTCLPGDFKNPTEPCTEYSKAQEQLGLAKPQHCSFCDEEGCNGTNGLKTNLILTVLLTFCAILQPLHKIF